jgi:beta-lactamase class A
MRRSVVVALLVAAAAVFTVAPPVAAKVSASKQRSAPLEAALPASAVSSSVLTSATQHVTTTLSALMHNPVVLTAEVEQMIAASGGSAGVTLIELGGTNPVTWSYNGNAIFTAASTYKLAALMMEAQNIAAGRTDPTGVICFEPDDYEEGWYADYAPGACFSRNDLAWRAGIKSDNTAGHMLVRDVGGSDALNAWAAAHGAKSSSLFDVNTTTSNDLAALWAAEARGDLGGAAAEAWLYPALTGTATENGIPSGVAGGITVAHKTGAIDLVQNDAALVSGPNGGYVLTVMTDGIGGDAGWQLIAAISSSIWRFESARPRP